MAEPGAGGGCGEVVQVGGLTGVDGAAGCPEQPVVAVAWLELLDPAGQAGYVGVPGPVRRCRAMPPRIEKPGDGGPVQSAGSSGVGDQPVGTAADLRWRGQDVSPGRLEVQVVPGQPARWLGAAGVVGVQPAAGGGDDRAGPAEQPGPLELVAGGEAVAGRAALVDVEDVGAGQAGGDGEVGGGLVAVLFVLCWSAIT